MIFVNCDLLKLEIRVSYKKPYCDYVSSVSLREFVRIMCAFLNRPFYTIITKTTDESQTSHRRVQTSYRRVQTSYRRVQTNHRGLQTSYRQVQTSTDESQSSTDELQTRTDEYRPVTDEYK